MASVAVTYTFSAGTTAASGELNQNYSDLVTYINNRNAGSATWDYVNVTGTVANPVTIKSSASTTEVAIDNTATDGDPIISFKLSGVAKYAMGVDDSVSDNFVIAASGALGTTNAISINTSGNLSIAGAVSFTAVSTAGIVVDTDVFVVDTTNNRVGIGTASPENTLHVFKETAGTISTAAQSIVVLERNTTCLIEYQLPNNVAGGITFSDPDASRRGELTYNHSGDIWSLTAGGTNNITSTATAFDPVGTGLVSSGTASNYWNDISYKTLTDRGCLGWFDEGVELPDGSKVSDTEAILSIEKDETKETIYGVPMLKYKSFPKVCYKKAEVGGVPLPRDANDEPIGGSDGVEMTAMQSIMIGALKELTNRVKALEAK